MHVRMKNPVLMFPEATQAIANLNAVIDRSSPAPATRNLARLRASQINGSGSCIYEASKQAREEGETEVRLIGLTGWRESPYYTGAERAALALTEEVTRLQGAEPVPDHVWQDASKHFDEDAMSALLLAITITNAENRFSISTRQVAADPAVAIKVAARPQLPAIRHGAGERPRDQQKWATDLVQRSYRLYNGYSKDALFPSGANAA